VLASGSSLQIIKARKIKESRIEIQSSFNSDGESTIISIAFSLQSRIAVLAEDDLFHAMKARSQLRHRPIFLQQYERLTQLYQIAYQPEKRSFFVHGSGQFSKLNREPGRGDSWMAFSGIKVS
jgi:hypothetical protein